MAKRPQQDPNRDVDDEDVDKHPPGAAESGSGGSKEAKEGDSNRSNDASGTTKQNESKPTGSDDDEGD